MAGASRKGKSTTKQRTKKSTKRQTRSAPILLGELNRQASQFKIQNLRPLSTRLRTQTEMERGLQTIQASSRFGNKKHEAGKVISSASKGHTILDKVKLAMLGTAVASQEVGILNRGALIPRGAYTPVSRRWNTNKFYK